MDQDFAILVSYDPAPGVSMIARGPDPLSASPSSKGPLASVPMAALK
jgi:hypothetical protein